MKPLLGEEIAMQLIESSRRARANWKELFQKYEDVIPHLKMAAQAGTSTVSHPLVSGFIIEWAKNTTWGICDSGCVDAIGLRVPDAHIQCLAEFGGVEGFCFMIGDSANFCSASLGNNDHDRQFGLIINAPAWIELASHDEFQWSFNRQMHMVIQHEMAHFRHQKGERTETHAHCRGIAAVLHRNHTPRSREEFLRIVQDYGEISHNGEIKNLVLENGEPAWRLVRLWLHLFEKYSVNSRAV